MARNYGNTVKDNVENLGGLLKGGWDNVRGVMGYGPKSQAAQQKRQAEAKGQGNYYSSTTGQTYNSYADALKDPRVAAAAARAKARANRPPSTGSRRRHRGGRRSRSRPTTSPQVSMCWGPEGMVKMAPTGHLKKIKDIVIGDLILTSDDRVDIVEYVVKTTGKNIVVVNMSSLSLLMTPLHPVRPLKAKKFMLPTSFDHVLTAVDSVYNFVLRNRSHLVVNDVEAPTLGDGDRNDPVLAHDYWGTKKIIADLAKISIFTGSKTIILDAKENTVLKDGAGNDVGILHEALL